MTQFSTLQRSVDVLLRFVRGWHRSDAQVSQFSVRSVRTQTGLMTMFEWHENQAVCRERVTGSTKLMIYSTNFRRRRE